MFKGKILIGSPICQDPKILQYFLQSLHRLEIPDYEIFYHFIDDNHDVNSQILLHNFSEEVKNLTIQNAPQMAAAQLYKNHTWQESHIWKVADFKDQIISRAQQEGFAYLFLVDSDLFLHPQTVNHLISSEKEIIAEIFWTKWSSYSIPQPQVWLSDFYNQYEIQIGEQISSEEKKIRTYAFFTKLKNPGIYEVGGLGACTLISQKAITKGICFQRIKNINFWGEDRHFCIRANALGFDLFVDTHYPAYHVYRTTELPGGIEFLQKTAGL